MDLPRDQRWERIVESYSENPYLASQLGKQMFMALQSEHVVSTSKHFAVYSVPKGGRDDNSRTDPHVAFRELHTLLLAPFKAAIKEAGGLGVMSSYNDYDGIPVTGSNYFLTDILRNQWGFNGYVVSDSKAVEFLHDKHHVAATPKDAVYQSVTAGLNVRTQFTPPEDFILPLRELIKEGTISMELIDSRVSDVLRVKFWLGLFDNPYNNNPEHADEIVACSQHLEVSLKASRECIVLLKNNGILPLDKKQVKNILVTGPNATRTDHAISRYGSSNVEAISILDGMKNLTGTSVNVEYTIGCKIIDENYPESEIMDFPISANAQKEIDKAVELTANADVIIAAMGEHEYIVGEGRSRTSLDLPGNQKDLLKALYVTGKPVILVPLNGRPLSVNWSDKNLPAIIEGMFPGIYGGQAIAEVIFGDYNPGGKLAYTYPKSVGQIEYNFPYKPGSQSPPAKWSWLQGSSMIDGALYPFGYGLSYTTFEYSGLRISPQKQKPDG